MKQMVKGIVGVSVFMAAAALFGFFVMFLWNKLMPDIFAFPLISYPQALGLLVLARILFGGMTGGNGHGNPFRDKWTGMSEKERADFLQKHGHIFHDCERARGLQTACDRQTASGAETKAE